jgi:hypothetical protein
VGHPVVQSDRVIITTPQGDELRRLGPERTTIGPGEILLFACVRNEAVRLPYFLHYYRGLAVTRFIVVDNDSSDGTTAFLLAQADVDVYHTAAPYAGSHYGVHWLNSLLRAFGSDHWVVVVDADELLVYPRCETVPLPSFVRALDASGADALLTFLLDMYPDGAIDETAYRPGMPFLGASPYFDRDSYTCGSEGLRARLPERGGPRRRLFWPPGRERRGTPPYLQKIPLVRWRDDLHYLASTHLIDGLQLASTTGVLLHFKFLADFAHRSRSEVERGQHWDHAAQYEAYVDVLSADPRLSALYEGSVRYVDSRQLIDLGLMLDEA